MVPPPLMLELAEDESPPELPPVRRTWVRVVLFGIGLTWLGLFAVAWRINPYPGGVVQLEGTHRQLGLPSCNFRMLTDLPCPSCGMSTSFALLVRGDLANSLRANFVGTLLALIGIAYFPWAALSLWRGRWPWVRELEPWLIRFVFGWVALMLLRWAAILAWMWWTG